MPRTWRGRGPVEGPPPPDGARTRRGHLRLDKLDPLLLGGQAHDPLALALSLSSARSHPVLHKSARPAAPLYVPPPKGAPRGRGLKPCVAFYFFFLHLEERTVFDSALFMFLLGNKRWLCACVFSCVGFFKEMGRRKKLPFPCSLPPPFCPSDTPTPAPFFFCFVLLRVHIPVCNPWFARFSVFSKVSLCQLCSPPPLSPVGALWAGRGLARSPPLSPIPSFLRPSAEEGERERALGTLRSSDERRAPSRRSWALGLLMSRLGGGRWRLQPAFGISEPRVSPLGRSDCRMESRQPQPEAGKKRENFNFLGLCFTVK